MDRLTCMEAFVRVAEVESFSEAARRWGRSRAVLSKYVQQLEEHLEVPLLRRTTRKVTLTDAGRVHLEACRQVLGLVSEAEAELRATHHTPAGVIRVTAPPGLVSVRLRTLVVDFLERHPGVELDLDLTHRMVDLVEERVDVAVRMTRPEDSSLIARRLGPAGLVVVSAPGRFERPSHPRGLAELPCICDTNFRFHPRWPFRVDGESVRVSVSGPVRANSPLVVRDLVLEGVGVGLVPRVVVADALARGQLALWFDEEVDAGWSVWAVTHERRQLAARTRAFLAHLAAHWED